MIKNKLKEWLARYLLAEILAIIGSLCGSLLANYLFENSVLTALAGTWGENTGYYGKIIINDLKASIRKEGKLDLRLIIKLIRDEILEFGVGEYIDSFVVRPFAMWYIPQKISPLFFGILIAKFTADISFYIPTIISYELKKKYLKDKD